MWPNLKNTFSEVSELELHSFPYREVVWEQTECGHFQRWMTPNEVTTTPVFQERAVNTVYKGLWVILKPI